MNLDLYYTVVMYVLAGMFGLCVGSFLNVVIYRVPLGMSVAFPGSHCTTCDYTLKWYDNIPVISYLLLGGKCRKCKQHISFRYTAVELLNMFLWLLSFFIFGKDNIIYAAICAVTFSVLLCIFFIDLEHLIIFDRFQIILGVLGICVTVMDFFDGGAKALLSHIIGLFAGFLSFFLIGYLGEKVLKREALGGGDIKLFAVMGLFLGVKSLLLCALISSLFGSIILIALQSIKNEKEKEYPFGPFLVFGFSICMLFGDKIINWYLCLF